MLEHPSRVQQESHGSPRVPSLVVATSSLATGTGRRGVNTPRLGAGASHQVVVYKRALHPELFRLRARGVARHGEYELESWIVEGGHVLRFARGGFCVCELMIDQERTPASGVVGAFLCVGERDWDYDFKPEPVVYMTTMQTETLSENPYTATYEELSQLASRSQGASYAWRDESGHGLAVIDVQQYHDQVHAQCYRMTPAGRQVVRTQTIFELTGPARR